MKEYVKAAKGQECIAFEVMEDLVLKYNPKFRTLRLPEPIRIDKLKNQVIMEYYTGKAYDLIWHEIYGGGMMGMELSQEIPEVIYDLTKIDTKPIESDERISRIPFFKFEYENWREIFKTTSEKFIRAGLLNRAQVQKASNIFDSEFESEYIFSNGDFYPGNFIQKGDKVVLIDWQTWDADYRANLIDYWENVMAFCYIHMWTNEPWQEEFLRRMRRYFDLQPGNFQKSVLIKSFEQANFWLGKPATIKYAADQIGIFKKFLDCSHSDRLLDAAQPNLLYRYFRPIINFIR